MVNFFKSLMSGFSIVCVIMIGAVFVWVGFTLLLALALIASPILVIVCTHLISKARSFQDIAEELFNQLEEKIDAAENKLP